MIPSSPMQLALLGSTLYGELYLGLCRALAAPWLDPRWLARPAERAGAEPGEPHPAVPQAAVRHAHARARPAGPRRAEPGLGQVIEVPAARWRERRAPSP